MHGWNLSSGSTPWHTRLLLVSTLVVGASLLMNGSAAFSQEQEPSSDDEPYPMTRGEARLLFDLQDFYIKTINELRADMALRDSTISVVREETGRYWAGIVEEMRGRNRMAWIWAVTTLLVAVGSMWVGSRIQPP